MKKKKTENETAMEILAQTKLTLVDAARLVVEMLEENAESERLGRRDAIKLCRRIMQLGGESYRLAEQTVTLREAVLSLQENKKDMRERTQTEIRQVCTRFMEGLPGFADEPVRGIDTEKCRHAIENAFFTLPSRIKAKRVISSLFKHAKLKGWCSSNPVKAVQLPRHKEKRIKALTIDEVVALLRTVEQPEHIMCAPAVGLMLWAGIRPFEIERLQVKHISFEDNVITVTADHSKTGGARQVTLHPVLVHWLRKTMLSHDPEDMITPACWRQRWSKLRKAAGFEGWPPDVLRHSFASYHLKYFKDVQALQLEMGHASLDLLRTRYLAMEGVTNKGAHIYWNYDMPRKS